MQAYMHAHEHVRDLQHCIIPAVSLVHFFVLFYTGGWYHLVIIHDTIKVQFHGE